MRTIRWIIFCLFPLLVASQTASHPTFDEMMGDISYVETPEDKIHYQAFASLYENYHCSASTIPKTLHFVWLGSHSITNEVLKCLRAWVQFHPAWEIYFWSDHPHPLPHERIQRKSIRRFSKLLPSYFQSINNLGDQSFLVRLLILREFGGVSPDCDVEPHFAIDDLVSKNAFLGVADPIQQTCLSSSVSVDPCFIAAAPGHPIISDAWEKIQSEWESIDAYFPEGDDESYSYRSLYHTRAPFTRAILDQAQECDAIVPPGFFTQITPIFRHLKLKLWNAERIKFEDRVFSLIDSLHSQQDSLARVIYWLCSSSVIILGLISALLVILMRQKNLAKKSLNNRS